MEGASTSTTLVNSFDVNGIIMCKPGPLRRLSWNENVAEFSRDRDFTQLTEKEKLDVLYSIQYKQLKTMMSLRCKIANRKFSQYYS
jgi:hypothetical protein